MAKLIVVTRGGTEHEIEGDTSLTVMENIRDASFDELLRADGSGGLLHTLDADGRRLRYKQARRNRHD